MAKLRVFTSLKASLIAPVLVFGALAAQPANAEIYASIVIDMTHDEVLHARHADEARFPASLTKVMTLYMLFDELEAGRISLDDELTVSAEAASQPPSNLRLAAGDTITVRDAILALVTKSANDVAVVVAEHIGGTEERFAALMTVKARTLGMENTRFYNASGLPDARQVSTARDMAVLAEAVYEDHGAYYEYFSTQSFTWGGRTYRNHNELLGEVAGVDGIKTGYTRASGYNLMASAQRGESRVVAVMLGGRTSRSRNEHVAELIEAAYAAIGVPGAGEAVPTTQVAFDQVRDPIHPDAAAAPVLNGQIFAIPVGEGDTTQ